MGVEKTSRALPGWIIDCDVNLKQDLNLSCETPVCHHSRFMTECFDVGCDKIISFSRCTSNEYKSIVNRHVVPQLDCTDEAVGKMFVVADRIIEILRPYGLQPLSRTEVIETRPPRIKKRYRNVLYNDLSPGMGKSFIKFEKKELDYDKSIFADEEVPRLIQYRSSSYTLELARFTVVMEKALQQCMDDVPDNFGLPFIAKGLDPIGRAKLLRKMWSHFRDPVAHLIDHSKFDSMVNCYHHYVERKIMVDVFQSKLLGWLYKQQVNNRFISQNGIKYDFPFRRCSGDANTSLGNSLINYCILRSCYPDAAIVVDGDDSVVITGTVSSKIDFTEFGMKTKHEEVTCFEQIEFCQSRPVHTPIGWVMCRNPLRAIARMNVRLGKQPNLRDWFWTVGVGEGLCSAYMPIITSMAKRFRKQGWGGKYALWMLEAGERYRIRTSMYSSRFYYPDDSTRASFAIAWGISPDLQRHWEERLEASVLVQG